MPKKTIYLDHKILTVNPSVLKKLTPGYVKGVGAFETMYFDGERVEFFAKHMARLRKALNILRLSYNVTNKQTLSIIQKLIQKNKLNTARVRLMVWKEDKVRRCAIVAQLSKKPSTTKYQQGFRSCLSTHHRNSSKYSHIKSIDYQLFHNARKEALANGCDEGILCNDKGHLVEGAYSNIFLIKNKTLLTPKVSDGCLNGIVRQAVMSLARKMNLTCQAKSLTIKHLQACDEAFFTNSIMGVMPLTYLKRAKIGNGKPGPLTRQIRQNFQICQK